MKKKKVVIALLASLCVAASAAGLAACQNNTPTTDNSPTYDPALYAAYQTYVSSFESEDPDASPKSYEEWLADILAMLEAKPEKGDNGAQGPQGPAGERGDDGENGTDGEDGIGIADVSIWTDESGKQYFQFTFTNGKVVRLPVDGEGEPIVSTEFTINAVDQYGNPVVNAYFSVGYMDSSYMNYYLTNNDSRPVSGDSATAATVKSNRYGVATLYTFLPNPDLDYRVYIADNNAVRDGNSAIPGGYTANLGSVNGIPNLSIPFDKGDDNYSVTVNFTLSNGWGALYDSTNDLGYKRYVQDYTKPDEITEKNTSYVKRVSRNRYNYITLQPFHVEYPSSMDDELESLIDDLALKTASGIYRVSWTASNSAANVELNLYSFTGNNVIYTSNADGSPADSDITMRSGTVPTDEKVLQEKYQQYASAYGSSAVGYSAWYETYAASFSGGNYVDVEIEKDIAHLKHCLGFVADVNCTITITVERVGDARVWTEIFDVKQMPSNASSASNVTGRIIDVPFNSTIVKDSNGTYRIGSASGDIVYVQLLNPSRANNVNSMEELTRIEMSDGDGGTYTRSVFNYYKEEYNAATHTGIRTYTDYTNIVTGYAKLANNDGLYPVNDIIKELLLEYCAAYYSGYRNYEQYWLAACYYYGPAANGTENAPYDLKTGSNSITLNGNTYVSFKPTTAGYYGFSSTVGTMSITSGVDVAGVQYVYVDAYEEFKFAINGSGSTNVTVATITSAKTIEYEYGENAVVGTDANPVSISGSGVYQVNINHDVSNNQAIAVNISAQYMADGNYLIEIYGSTTATILDADKSNNLNGTIIALTNATKTRIWVDDVTDGTFFIKVTKQ